ncbi:hypothetical protein CC2G_009392 [Coprinopsis cinerea AmutBmut pab1-1]|nr:hypothetical protein CC2G_009392 [Coprinopsis cinerea AmutBmut pab1-1]
MKDPAFKSTSSLCYNEFQDTLAATVYATSEVPFTHMCPVPQVVPETAFKHFTSPLLFHGTAAQDPHKGTLDSSRVPTAYKRRPIERRGLILPRDKVCWTDVILRKGLLAALWPPLTRFISRTPYGLDLGLYVDCGYLP